MTDATIPAATAGADRPESLPPGPSAPGSIQTLRWMFRPIPMMERYRRRYGPLFTMRLGPATVVMVAEPDIAKAVLNGDPAVFRAGETNSIFRPVVGSHSILLLDGGEHLRHRRILLPAFGHAHAKVFEKQVREAAQRRIAGWEPGERLSLRDEMEAIAFDSILRIVFGGAGDGSSGSLRQLIPEMMDRCDSPYTLIPWFRRELGGLSPYARLMRVLDLVDRALYGAIEERRADPMTQFREDVLSLLLRATDEYGEPLPDRAIRDELLTMIMAGYETTTSGLAWAFERLLRTPAIVEQIRSDLTRGDLRYLDGVVKETLRIRPVVPVAGRRLREAADIGDYRIPGGTTLMVSIHLLHNDPNGYPQPEEFRPERFLGGNPPGAAWVPFGGGVRRCLGASLAQLEMRVVLSEVLSAVRLSPLSDGPEEAERKRFTFAPAEGAQALVEERIAIGAGAGERRLAAPVPGDKVRG